VSYTGFTLFFNPGVQKWQLSVRHEGEQGWIVNHVTEGKAERLFRLLETRLETLESAGADLAATLRRSRS
jgi:hypothetical protein